MDTLRFTNKDAFLGYLKDPEAKPLRTSKPNICEHPHGPVFDRDVDDITGYIVREHVVDLIQGFLNVGIDTSMRVNTRFKLFGCNYNREHVFIVKFPCGKTESSLLRHFIDNTKDCIVSKDAYQKWCDSFSTYDIKHGRKRKTVLPDEEETIHWLLQYPQEKELFDKQSYLNTTVTRNQTKLIKYIQEGFSVPRHKIEPAPAGSLEAALDAMFDEMFQDEKM